MDVHRVVAVATAVLILAVTLATGPLLGLSLTAEEEQFEPGSGTLDATVVTTPETATLEAARFGVEKYYLRAEPVELQIDGATGQPTVAYEIEIEEFGFTASSIAFFDASIDGSYQLEFEEAVLDADRIDSEQYDGSLRVVVVDEERTLVETEIRIEVTE